MKEMNRRLLAIGRPIRNYIAISTVASVLGALSHMGLMGFGALWLVAAAGFCDGIMSLCSPYCYLCCFDRSVPLSGRFILPFRCIRHPCENESTSF